MFLKNRHAKKIYKVGKSSRNTSNVKFHACVSIVHDWNLCFTKLVVFFFQTQQLHSRMHRSSGADIPCFHSRSTPVATAVCV